LACDAEGTFPAPEPAVKAFIVDVTEANIALDLTERVRSAGIGADRAFGGRSMKAQMKAADRSGARFALIVGSDELADETVTIRDLRGDTGQSQVPAANVVPELMKLLEDH